MLVTNNQVYNSYKIHHPNYSTSQHQFDWYKLYLGCHEWHWDIPLDSQMLDRRVLLKIGKCGIMHVFLGPLLRSFFYLIT